MNFDWKQYLNLAQDLITKPKERSIAEEAYYRSAISRSYYGIYGLTSTFMYNNNVYKTQYDKYKLLNPNIRSEHRLIRESLQSSAKREDQRIGANLKKLWDYRETSDYKSHIQINFGDAEIAYNTAEKILQDLKTIGAI